MKNSIIYSLFLFAILLLFSNCEDDISNEIELAPTANLVVIDAWIDNTPGEQVIQLSTSQPYLDSTNIAGISGAEVVVTDGSDNIFVFQESFNGAYVWTPPPGETFGEIGQTYALTVTVNGVTYSAFSTMNRVPPIDSITFRFEEENAFIDDSYFGEFWARDPAGEGDTYWIKAWKNGEYLGEPSEINIAFDGGFSQGGAVDDIIFIPPIRDGVNPFDEDENDELLSPYVPGDSLYVELHSITNDAFFFLNEVRIQTDRPGGFAELFATPLSNVPTNFISSDSNRGVLGFFNVSAVSTLGQRFEQ